MIKLQNVSKYYNSNGVVALGLRKVDLELHGNEFVAIVGESGSGKTTLLNVISGIDSYEDGEMYINGKETSYYSVEDMEDYRKNYVAFVFQSYNLIESYTVLQNVEAPLILSGYPKDEIRPRAKQIIKKVGLTDHMHHKATKLSGGQKQRVVIARALAKDCPIIAADEPTGNLDSKSAKGVIKLLQEIAKEKLVIIVTHDFSQVKEYATRKIRIYDGEIVEDLELKKTDKLDLPIIDNLESKIKFRDFLSISLRNLLAVPKKSLLMLIVFAFFSFFVALTYGSYQLSQNEINTSTNQVFTNASPNRIVVRMNDNSDMTDEIDDILNTSDKVIEVVDFDYVLDANIIMINTNPTGNYAYLDGVFMPLSFLLEDDLLYGRMPESDNEIVVGLNSWQKDEYDSYLNETFEFEEHSVSGLDKTYKVVGVCAQDDFPSAAFTSYNNYFFGTDANLESLKEIFRLMYTTESGLVYTDSTAEIGFQESGLWLNGFQFEIDNTLGDNELTVSKDYYYGACETAVCVFDGTLTLDDNYINKNELDKTLDITISFDDTLIGLDYIIYMNQTTYDEIFYDEIYQVSVITRSEIGVENIVSELRGSVLNPSDYYVVYPFDSEESQDFMALIILISNIGMIVLNIIVLLGSTFITYAIFKAIINTKLPDYAIFRTIGANKAAIKRFIYIENFFIVLVSFAIFLIVSIVVPEAAVNDTFLMPLKVYNFGNYVVFFLLLVIMAVMISRRYCNKIFSNTVQTTLKGNLG